jgi:hypothetical protein
MAPVTRSRKNQPTSPSTTPPAPAELEGSPAWTVDSEGNLPSRTPSPTALVTSESEDEVDELEDDPSASQLVSQAAINARRPRWKPFQDRMLAEVVEEYRPFELTGRDEARNAWQRISVKLFERSMANGATPDNIINRTGESCRARFKTLLDKHRVSFSTHVALFHSHLLLEG